MSKKKSLERNVKTVQIQVHELENCPGCGVAPGHIHVTGCLAELCSHCGYPRCKSEEHDPGFSRWTGIYPGIPECYALGLIHEDGSPDIATFLSKDLSKIFFAKPSTVQRRSDKVSGKTIVSSPNGEVWLTFSDLNEKDVVVHGVFTLEEYADKCAEEVRKTYPKRSVSTGSWRINEAWIDLSDGHLQ
jgi:hypothetical protein